MGNLVISHCASGVEVRTTDARRNTSKGNRISKNIKGGIALYDGSNDGIRPPVFSSVERLVGRTGVAGRSVATVRITGTADVSSGTVEVFTDPET